MSGERKVPGKIFLLGEYSILAGEPALLATVRIKKFEPFLGFGSSTAQWVQENSNLPAPLDTQTLWKNYRAQVEGASGADLAAQNESFLGHGSLFEVQVDTSEGEGFEKIKIEPLKKLPFSSQIHLFSASHDLKRKLPTDQALKAAKKITLADYPKSKPFIELWKNAKVIQDLSLLTEWTHFFEILKIETPEAHADRTFIENLDGVVGVKGCGAGLNDVFLVAIESTPEETGELCKKIAKERKLLYLGTLDSRFWNTQP